MVRNRDGVAEVGVQLLCFPICFPANQTPAEKEFTKKGKHLLPKRAYVYHLK